MDKTTAQRTVSQTFQAEFDQKRYRDFINELCNGFDESKKQTMQVPDAFAPHVASCQRLGTYESPDGELADVMVVHLTESFKLERTRTALRDFVAHKLKRGNGDDNSYKEAGLVAFVAPDARSWRFSLVRMEYATRRDPKTGKIKPEERLTPARRYSYLVGADEQCHTAKSRFVPLLQDTTDKPTLAQIEEAFSVEKVTKEFFNQYAALFQATCDELEKLVKKDAKMRADFKAKNVSTVDFAKKLLGQIVFLYFIQKKGWLGVAKGGNWGDGPRNFLRRLADKAIAGGECLFNDVLEPLFYDTLATDRSMDGDLLKPKNGVCDPCRIPFLNGGLFEPLAGYDWKGTDIRLPNSLFTNRETTKDDVTGTGILDVFDRYNFTVNEAEPLEKEVAIDPEMLGKVFENLIEENRRKGLGAYYTPREIVHYMCQESLINYLDTALNTRPEAIHEGKRKQAQLFGDVKAEQALLTAPTRNELIPRPDIEALIREGEQASHYEAARKDGTVSYRRQLPKAVEKHAQALDDALASITVCDPAIGSGAFPVGMMTEIVRARSALSNYEPLKSQPNRTPYHFKRHAIQNSLYGVDIDPGAVEIAKLRLWLSLVVDEEDVKQIKPLPNLDYKVVVGNSLLGVEKDLFNIDAFNKLERLKPQFFDASDHVEKVKLKKQIDSLIHTLTNGSETFDFEIFFSEVFHRRKGFDVVIANPPYIDSETMTKTAPALRATVQKRLTFTKGNWDIYIAFFEVGFNQLSGCGGLTFITPDKWISKPFGNEMRRCTTEMLESILHAGREVFENAKVDAIVTVYTRTLGKTVLVRDFDGRSFSSKRIVQKTEFRPPFAYDWLFSDNLDLLAKVESVSERLNSLGECENACATSDAYKLKEFIQNGAPAPDASRFLTIINTGTIGRYVSKWGLREMVYLGDRYLRPVIERKSFLRAFPNSYGKKSIKPKLIVKGLNLLDVCIDEDGLVIPGKTTLMITGQNLADLKIAMALLNCPLAPFYFKERYPAASYNQGTTFTKEMLNAYPVPALSKIGRAEILALVDKLLVRKRANPESDQSPIEGEINNAIYKLYGLTAEEIEIVEASAK